MHGAPAGSDDSKQQWLPPPLDEQEETGWYSRLLNQFFDILLFKEKSGYSKYIGLFLDHKTMLLMLSQSYDFSLNGTSKKSF